MTTSDESAPVQAVEQLPISLFDGAVLAARTSDGLLHLALNDMCITIGLDTTSQRRRIQANPSLHLTAIRVQVGRQFRTMDFLRLDDLAIWIITIGNTRTNKKSQERISYIKAYLEASVRSAFAQLTGLPAASHQIEDIRDLDRVDLALRGLAELGTRQTKLETSQDQLKDSTHAALGDLAKTVREVQEQLRILQILAKQKISPVQRGTIYQLVHVWGGAHAARHPGRRSGESIHMCWRQFNARFGIATYTVSQQQAMMKRSSLSKHSITS
jgi:hypothetical protein